MNLWRAAWAECRRRCLACGLCAALLPVALGTGAAHAQAPTCSSDRAPAPRWLVERFLDADCSTCWTRPQPLEPLGALTLDWIVPNARGDAAAMQVVALREATQRLAALQQATPPQQSVQRHRVPQYGARLRVAHGLALAGYIGTAIALDRAPDTDVQAWLLLVEQLPAGTEGSPVPRQLVRNVLVLDWPRGGPQEAYAERRPLSVPDGARAERLAVVGWVQSASGQILATARSRCPGTPP